MEAENALASQSLNHPDGWGIGWFVDDDAYVIKSSNAAHACERFRRTSSRLTSDTFLVHVRRATVGVIDHLNAHPFRFGRWLFCHNGTLFGFEQMSDWMMADTDAAFHPLIAGDTDSEHLFYWLLSRLMRADIDKAGRRPSDAAVVGQVIREALFELDEHAISLGLERPIVNVLLTDGRLLVAHKAGMPLFMSTQKHSCAEFETCAEPHKFCMLAVRPAGEAVNHLLVASEPIATAENRWETLEDGTTLTLDGSFHLKITAPPKDWQAPVLPERYRIGVST